MRRFTFVCLAAALAGCGGGADQANPPADSAALAPAPPAAPAALTLADLAGTWNVQVMPEDRDTVLLTYQLTATADTAGWSIKLPDRANPIPVHVVPPQGDSVVTHAGPYPSALRKNVTVSTESVMRLQNGAMVGRTTARYKTSGADSVVVLRQQGTRAQ